MKDWMKWVLAITLTIAAVAVIAAASNRMQERRAEALEQRAIA